MATKSLSLEQARAQEFGSGIERELAAYREMFPGILATYKGQFVALSEGKVIDSDKNELVLAQRASLNFKSKFVVIQEVSDVPSRKVSIGFDRPAKVSP